MALASTESRCKINLFLRVTGCRADGYHTLETLFWPLEEPSDTLEADFDADAPVFAFETDAPEIAGGDNSVRLAAARYTGEANNVAYHAGVPGIAPSWRFRLTKRIPIAAGLGGGSADAAAALRLLEGRFGILGGEKLKELALKLGADVPFFLDPRPAVGRGVGDELEYLPEGLPRLPLVLVNPGFPVRSEWAYRRFDECGAEPSKGTLEGMSEGLEKGDLEQVAQNVRNDLAPALWRKFPLLTRIRAELEKFGALVVEISGGGPTLFALLPDFPSAHRAAAELTEAHPQWRVFGAEES